jgi:cytochrome c5
MCDRNRIRRHRRLSAVALGLLALAAILIAVPTTAHEAGSAEAEDAEIVAWRERYMALGEDVYSWACAACHDTGEKNSPRIRDRDTWSNRSPLWSAVLLEHAKQGYLEMPAKGGHPYLSDRAVEAAGEYMLGETFPELPRD